MQYMHLDIKNLSEAILYAFEYTEPTITIPTPLSPTQPGLTPSLRIYL
jgi:hypothetical protein